MCFKLLYSAESRLVWYCVKDMQVTPEKLHKGAVTVSELHLVAASVSYFNSAS